VKVATTLKESIRTADVASRWGGEEFLILLANTSVKGAITTAEKIREAIKAQKVEPIQSITVSIGVTSYEGQEDLKDTISRADKALYQAKANGRDCVCQE
ncbi:MAG: GGDEF domain-containing protein, partial [Thermodesulfovibrionales bacterium]|nr:GGDEF domain-containing protein [Thermodesulfovibrionales bacterium]